MRISVLSYLEESAVKWSNKVALTDAKKPSHALWQPLGRPMGYVDCHSNRECHLLCGKKRHYV